MSELISYVLEYREDGENKIETFEIDFICHDFIDRYNRILSQVMDFKNKYETFEKNAESITSEKKTKVEGYKDRVKELKEENKSLVSSMANLGDETFFKKRFELLCDVLKENGVKEDKFFDVDFWKKKVRTGEIIRLLSLVIHKDMPKKKVV